MAFTGVIRAQDVLAPPPAEYTQPAAPLFRVGTNQLQSAQAATAAPSPSIPEMFRWGPFQLQPHLLYRVSYGNGIQSAPGQHENTVINEVSPGVLIDIGNRWRLDYTPTLRFYSSHNFRDTTDHSVALTGGTSYEDWTIGLSQSYVSSSTPLVETGSQTDQKTYATALNGGYHMSTKMSLELGLNQNFRFVGENQGEHNNQALSDSREWSTMDWLNYQFWPKFGLALGAGGGYLALTRGSDMTYEQVQGRLNWRVGNKLSLSFNGGFEDRQFVDSNARDLINPIFGLTILYQLFDNTSFSLSATRTVSASYFESQVTESMGVTSSFHQRLLGKLSFDLSGGYTATSYKSTTTGLSVNREDDRSFINVRLTCPFLKRGIASIYYDWSENVSNEAGFQYSSNQVGLEIGYRY